jgi:hypothetical protein
MDSRNLKKIVADWPEFLSYDNSDEKIKSFYSEHAGEKTKKSSIFYEKRLLDIFLLAMAIGKQSGGGRLKLASKSRTMPRNALTEEEIWIMTCVAFEEKEGDLNVLSDPKELVNICEEYANAGIRKLMALDYGSSITDPLEQYENLLTKNLDKLIK